LSRDWAEVVTSLKMPVEDIAAAAGDHGPVISSHQAQLLAVFAELKR
jgi:hypothetical protein